MVFGLVLFLLWHELLMSFMKFRFRMISVWECGHNKDELFVEM